MEQSQETSSPSEVISALYGATEITLDESKQTVSIGRVKIKNMSAVLGLAKDMLTTLGITDGKVTIDLKNPEQLLGLMSSLPDQCTSLMVMLSSLTKEKVEDLDLADGLQLLVAVIQVNRSFFMEKVLPKLAGLREIKQASQPPSV